MRDLPMLGRYARITNRLGEFALYKGHRYATVMHDRDTRRVLWVGEGRSREAIRPFFEWLGKERCGKIEEAAMDMNTAFDLEVQQHCSQARVVYDLFHVIAKCAVKSLAGYGWMKPSASGTIGHSAR